MGSRTIGSLLVKLNFDPKEVDQGIKKFEKNLKATARNMESAGRAMSIGFTAPFLLAARQSLKAYDEEAKAVRKLEVALGGTSKALLAQAAAIQKTTIYADDAVIGVQAYAAALGHSESEISKMTTAAVGLAAGLGIGLEEAMAMLHKSTLGASKGLGNLIPGVKDLTKEQLKAGEAIDMVNEKFAGYAEAMALTGSGPVTMLTNSIGDLSEQFGKALLPIVVAITDKIGSFVEGLKAMSEEDMKAAVGIGILVASIGPLLLVLPKIITFVGVLLSEVGLITAAVVALGLAFTYVWKNMEAFKDAAKQTWGGIKEFFNPSNTKHSGSWGDEASNKTNRTPDAQFQSFGDFVGSIGTDIADALGFDTGILKMDAANKLLEGMATKLKNIQEPADKAAKSLEKVAAVIIPEGRNPLSGIAGMSTGIFNGQTSSKQELTPASDWAGVSDGWKDGLKDQAETVNDLTESWFTLADGIGLATGMIDGFLSEGGKSFGKYALEALKGAMQVARAKMIEIAVNVVAGSSKAGLPGLIAGIVGATAGIALIGKLLSGIQAPALAQGGQTVGPTMALIGDNPSGKEMVLPFERTGEFARAIGSQIGGGGSRVVGVIRGRDIHLVTSQEQGYASRRGSGNLITF